MEMHSSTRSVPAETRAKGKNVEKLVTRSSIDDITETVITEAEVPVAAASAKEKPETGMNNGLPTPTPSPTDDDDEEMDPGLDDRIQEIKPFAGGLKA